jgi:hypothetical protein
LKENPDVIVIASGAAPSISEYTYNKKTITSWQVLNDVANIGKNIIIYDPFSNNEGVGVAEYLFETYENIKIQYFTSVKSIGLDVLPENLDVLFRKLMPFDFSINPFYVLEKADADKIVFRKIYTKKKYIIKEYDNLIFVGQMKSCDDLYWKLKKSIIEVFRIGDAKAPAVV